MLPSGVSSECLQQFISVYTTRLQRTLYPIYAIEQTSSRPDGTLPLAQMLGLGS